MEGVRCTIPGPSFMTLKGRVPLESGGMATGPAQGGNKLPYTTLYPREKDSHAHEDSQTGPLHLLLLNIRARDLAGEGHNTHWSRKKSIL